MDAQDFISFADELSGTQMTQIEASCRTTISRLYYGVFLHIETWLKTHHKKDYFKFKTGGTHKKVTDCLSYLAKTYNQPQIEDLAEHLKNFKGDRVGADYHLNRIITSSNVELAQAKRDEAIALFNVVQLLHIVMPPPAP